MIETVKQHTRLSPGESGVSRLTRAREQLAGLIAPGAARTLTPGALIELCVFALAAPLIGVLLFRHDPLGLHSGFPWAALAPVIFAARYGSARGLACTLVAALAFMLVARGYYQAEAARVVALSLGTIILGLVVGDAATQGRKRSRQVDAENHYLRHRLKEFSNDYHVLSVSHAQLEEFMAGQRLSLRQAMQQLKPVLSLEPDGMNAGSELMSVFAQFCSIQVAGLYAMRSDVLVNPVAVATHGDMPELPLFDPLLKRAIAERKLTSIKLDSLATDQRQHALLAVVPIVDSRDQLHGILAIKDMHFMAFQQENLNILALLAGFTGDLIARSGSAGNSDSSAFMAELDTSLRFARSHGVESSLLRLTLAPGSDSAAIAQFLGSSIRGLDSSWQPPASNDDQTVIVLLPLLTNSGCEAYLQRVANSVQQQFGVTLEHVLKQHAVLGIDAGVQRMDCLRFIDESTGVLKKARRTRAA